MIYEHEKEELIEQKAMKIRVSTLLTSIITLVALVWGFYGLYNSLSDKITNTYNTLERRIVILEINQQNKANRDELRVIETKLTNIENIVKEIKDHNEKK